MRLPHHRTKIKRRDFVCKEMIMWHILNINDIRKIVFNFEERWMVEENLDQWTLQIVVRVNQRWKMSTHSGSTTGLTDCRKSRLCFHDRKYKRKVKVRKVNKDYNLSLHVMLLHVEM